MNFTSPNWPTETRSVVIVVTNTDNLCPLKEQPNHHQQPLPHPNEHNEHEDNVKRNSTITLGDLHRDPLAHHDPQSSSSSVPQSPTISVIPGGLVPRIITPTPVVPQGPLDMRDPIPWLLPIHMKRLFRTPPAPLSLPMSITMGSTPPQSVRSPLGEV